MSAWVKCPPSAPAASTVVQWASPASQSSTLARMALSTASSSNTSVASIGSGAGAIGAVFTSTSLTTPRQAVWDNFGNMYILNYGVYSMMRWNTTANTLTKIVGTGVNGKTDGVGTNALMNYPSGITISQDGQTVYWSEYGTGSVRQVYLPTMPTTTLVCMVGR